MQHATEFNSLAFIMQGGFVSISVALILLIMSVASWYFMLVKTVQNIQIKSALKRYIAEFWAAPNLQAAISTIKIDSPAQQLAVNAVDAAYRHQLHASKHIEESCSYDEFVARSMRRSVAQTSAKLESGLSVLASVGRVVQSVTLLMLMTNCLITDTSMRNKVVNIANSVNYSMLEIVGCMEKVVGKKAIYQIESRGSEYNINIDDTLPLIESSAFKFGDTYLLKVMEKYYGYNN